MICLRITRQKSAWPILQNWASRWKIPVWLYYGRDLISLFCRMYWLLWISTYLSSVSDLFIQNELNWPLNLGKILKIRKTGFFISLNRVAVSPQLQYSLHTLRGGRSINWCSMPVISLEGSNRYSVWRNWIRAVCGGNNICYLWCVCACSLILLTIGLTNNLKYIYQFNYISIDHPQTLHYDSLVKERF